MSFIKRGFPKNNKELLKMNLLLELEEEYKKGSISKEEYIKRMHEIHLILGNYSEFIKNKNINSISIMNDYVAIETRKGIKLICNLEDERATPLEVLNFGNYESEEIKMIETFLKADSVILDIGANVGWYSMHLAISVPRGKVIAFEPIPKIFDYLKRNIALNNIKNIETYNFGLSEKKEVVEFYFDPKLTGATSLRNLHENREKIKIECNVEKMDDIIPRITTRIDFIKCDVEGAEILVVKGGLEVLKKHKPVLFLEMLRKWSAKFDYHPNDIILILKEIGYKCYCAKGEKLVEVESVNEDTLETNFFFIHGVK